MVQLKNKCDLGTFCKPGGIHQGCLIQQGREFLGGERLPGTLGSDRRGSLSRSRWLGTWTMMMMMMMLDVMFVEMFYI